MTTPDERAAVLDLLCIRAIDLTERVSRWRARPPFEVLAELGELRAELHGFEDTLADLVIEVRAVDRRERATLDVVRAAVADFQAAGRGGAG